MADPAFRGFIETTLDALLIFEGCRRGVLPKITRRLQEFEKRALVTSGAIFVFDEEETGIKRWTDGLSWSPSRTLGNFLIYREWDKKASGGGASGPSGSAEGLSGESPPPDTSVTATGTTMITEESGGETKFETPSSSTVMDDASTSATSTTTASTSVTPAVASSASSPRTGPLPIPTPSSISSQLQQRSGSESSSPYNTGAMSTATTAFDRARERALVGSLTSSYRFRSDGLVKKTISLSGLHMIGYYKIEDVTSGRLRSPSTHPELSAMQISSAFLVPTLFRAPPIVEIGMDGQLRYKGEPDAPLSPMTRSSSSQGFGTPGQSRSRPQSVESISATSPRLPPLPLGGSVRSDPTISPGSPHRMNSSTFRTVNRFDPYTYARSSPGMSSSSQVGPSSSSSYPSSYPSNPPPPNTSSYADEPHRNVGGGMEGASGDPWPQSGGGLVYTHHSSSSGGGRVASSMNEGGSDSSFYQPRHPTPFNPSESGGDSMMASASGVPGSGMFAYQAPLPKPFSQYMPHRVSGGGVGGGSGSNLQPSGVYAGWSASMSGQSSSPKYHTQHQPHQQQSSQYAQQYVPQASSQSYSQQRPSSSHIFPEGQYASSSNIPTRYSQPSSSSSSQQHPQHQSPPIFSSPFGDSALNRSNYGRSGPSSSSGGMVSQQPMRLSRSQGGGGAGSPPLSMPILPLPTPPLSSPSTSTPSHPSLPYEHYGEEVLGGGGGGSHPSSADSGGLQRHGQGSAYGTGHGPSLRSPSYSQPSSSFPQPAPGTRPTGMVMAINGEVPVIDDEVVGGGAHSASASLSSRRSQHHGAESGGTGGVGMDGKSRSQTFANQDRGGVKREEVEGESSSSSTPPWWNSQSGFASDSHGGAGSGGGSGDGGGGYPHSHPHPNHRQHRPQHQGGGVGGSHSSHQR